MNKYRQLVTGDIYGDCFRACMATILQLPPIVLPNDFSPMWHSNWEQYLNQFGMALCSTGLDLSDQFWIAFVPSLNYKNGTHAIIMHNTNIVFHDPSNKKRYKAGTCLGGDIVLHGMHLAVADVMKFHLLDEYRIKLMGENENG